MSIKREEITRAQVAPFTQPHPTYYVAWGDSTELKPTCFRPIRADSTKYCALPAGYDTDHPQVGACRKHMGISDTAGTTRYLHIARGQFKRNIEEFANDPEALSLIPELLLTRGVLSEALKNYQETKSRGDLMILSRMLSEVKAMVAAIEHIQSQQVLTYAAGRYMMAKALDVASRFIEPERLPVFVEAWREEVQAPMTNPKLIEGGK